MANENKYLDPIGLIRLIANIKFKFDEVGAAIADKPDMSDLTSGDIVVKESEHADSATTADSATNADHATSADTATNANHATSADTATTATNANHATTADSASSANTANTANSATKATQDGSGNVITETYETIANADETEAALRELINGKAAKATTLSGYGITDAYTKSQVDSALSGKANSSDIPTVPTNVSAFTNDAGYISAIPSEYVTETELSAKGYIASIPSEYITESELEAKKYLTSIPSEYVTDSELTAKGYATQSSLDAHTNNDLHITSAERTKLAGIAAGAQVNTITGVKGNSESTYRTGNVNITAANIGLGNVNNTSDANKPVSTAQQSAIDEAQAAANTYTDQKIADLLDNDTAAVDSIMELASAMKDNADAIDALREIAGGKADAGHNHDDKYYTESEIDLKISVINDAIDGKASKSTTLSGYGISDAYTKTQIDSTVSGLNTAIGEKADSSHTHSISNVTNLQSTLNTKANASDLTSHTGNKSNPHGVTAAQVGAYTTTEIDSKVSAINTSIDGKAAKATTLSGYGITDAYTKSQMDSSLSNKADASALTSHTGNSDVHVTTTQKTNWNTAYTHSQDAHKYAGSSTTGGAANSVASSIKIQLNGGTTEGTNQFTFNGSAAKNINITPASIGAQASGSYASATHSHDDKYYTESEIDSKISTINTAIGNKADKTHTHSISDIANLQSKLDNLENLIGSAGGAPTFTDDGNGNVILSNASLSEAMEAIENGSY